MPSPILCITASTYYGHLQEDLFLGVYEPHRNDFSGRPWFPELLTRTHFWGVGFRV